MIEFSSIVYHTSAMCNKVYRHHDLSPLTFTNTLNPINMRLNMSVIHCSSEVRDRMNDITFPFYPPPRLTENHPTGNTVFFHKAGRQIQMT